MMRDFFYKIENFGPPIEIGKLGGYGFSIKFNRSLARKVLLTEISQEKYSSLQHLGEMIIKDTGLAKQDERIKPPYNFAKNDKGNLTYLAQFINVPGNACFLDLSHSEVDELRDRKKSFINWIQWNSHNVDTSLQAYSLLSIWLKWANKINLTLS